MHHKVQQFKGCELAWIWKKQNKKFSRNKIQLLRNVIPLTSTAWLPPPLHSLLVSPEVHPCCWLYRYFFSQRFSESWSREAEYEIFSLHCNTELCAAVQCHQMHWLNWPVSTSKKPSAISSCWRWHQECPGNVSSWRNSRVGINCAQGIHSKCTMEKWQHLGLCFLLKPALGCADGIFFSCALRGWWDRSDGQPAGGPAVRSRLQGPQETNAATAR